MTTCPEAAARLAFREWWKHPAQDSLKFADTAAGFHAGYAAALASLTDRRDEIAEAIGGGPLTSLKRADAVIAALLKPAGETGR